jgi:ARG/rhodanese/phosphatase superfamily protein
MRSREKGWQGMPDDLSNVAAGQESGAVATAVRELIEGVRAGEALRAGGLTLIPLLPATERVKRQSGYLPLEEALKLGLVTVTEQAQATVPELMATSTAETPVVLVGGEQVIGGLQNRVLNTTILVAAHVTQPIPVTCVEAGRWHDTGAYAAYANVADDDDAPVSMDANVAQAPTPRRQTAARAFTSDEAGYASLRRMHSKAVTASLSSGRGHRSDQGAVWGEVSARMVSTGSYSSSDAMDTLYKTPERANKLAETMGTLKRPDGALGFVAAVGSKVLGAEIFTDEALADAYWEKLARSYAVEALDAAPGGDDTTNTTATGDDAINVGEARLLADALAAEIQVHPSPGLGADARLVGSHVSGAGLVYDGAVVHLSLFPEDEASGEPDDSGAQQPTQAQRHYGGHRQSGS